MENLYKSYELTINISPQKRSNISTNTEFFTYDQQTAKKIINFQLEGNSLDLTDAEVILGFDFVDAASSKILDSTDGSVSIDDPVKGQCSVMLPNDLYAYSGDVLIHVYVVFSDGKSFDCATIVTSFKESWIDQELEEMSEFYVKQFDDLRSTILSRAEELKKRVDDIERKIDNVDFITLNEMNRELASLMLGKPIIYNQVMTFEGKVRGSMVENPHRGTAGNGTVIFDPGISGGELTQVIYETLVDSNDEFFTLSSSAANFFQFVSTQWNVLETVRRRYPVFFTGNEQRDVVFLREIVRRVTLEIECFGRNELYLGIWNGSQWVYEPPVISNGRTLQLTVDGMIATSRDSTASLARNIDGTASFVVHGGQMANNQIGVGKTTLQVELAISLPDLYQRINA